MASAASLRFVSPSSSLSTTILANLGIQVATRTSDAWLLWSGIVKHGQPSESKRSEQEPEIAQSDIEERTSHDQVEDDPREPGRDDVGADARLQSYEERGHDFDDSDRLHGGVHAERGQPSEGGGEVAGAATRPQ
jgi:hypothetical protein